MKAILVKAIILTSFILFGVIDKASATAPEWVAKCQSFEELTQQENPSFQHLNCLITNASLEADIPPEVVKAIVTQENNGWKQFDENGEPVISDDGGIGLMQITNKPEYDQQKLKYDVYYNIEKGIEILNDMYDRSDLPKIKGVGREIIENWYFPAMAYNGTKPVNSPIVQATGEKNLDAYQEKVFASIENDSFLDGTKLAQYPFRSEDFQYDPKSDDNIVFLKKEYTMTDQLHRSTHLFKSGDKVMITMDGVRLRKQTSGSQIITNLTKGTTLIVKGNFIYDQTPTSLNQFVWYPVSTEDQKYVGYVSSSYLTGAVQMTNVSTNITSPQAVNNSIQITADAKGGFDRLYKFFVNDGSGWKVLREYATNPVYDWTPTKAGDYQISVYVKDRNSTKSQDDFKIISYKITDTANPVTIKNVVTNFTSPQQTGKNIQITAEATGGTEKLYKFYLNDGSGWMVLRDYTTNPMYDWTPMKAGHYQLSVYVKDRASTNKQDDFMITPFVIQ